MVQFGLVSLCQAFIWPFTSMDFSQSVPGHAWGGLNVMPRASLRRAGDACVMNGSNTTLKAALDKIRPLSSTNLCHRHSLLSYSNPSPATSLNGKSSRIFHDPSYVSLHPFTVGNSLPTDVSKMDGPCDLALVLMFCFQPRDIARPPFSVTIKECVSALREPRLSLTCRSSLR
jgi:hypothetical protein